MGARVRGTNFEACTYTFTTNSRVICYSLAWMVSRMATGAKCDDNIFYVTSHVARNKDPLGYKGVRDFVRTTEPAFVLNLEHAWCWVLSLHSVGSCTLDSTMKLWVSPKRGCTTSPAVCINIWFPHAEVRSNIFCSKKYLGTAHCCYFLTMHI